MSVSPAFVQPAMSLLPPRPGSLPDRATLQEFRNFHGMWVSPRSAQRCIRDINGCILFMPKTYGRNLETFPRDGISRFEVTTGGLNLLSYYLLVLASATGLSTALKQTSFLDGRETSDFVQEEPLVVDQMALDYITRHGKRMLSQSGVDAPSVRLARRFEYNFHVANLRVVMLHFVSILADGTVATDSDGREVLHLVEVYDPGDGLWSAWWNALSVIAKSLMRVAGVGSGPAKQSLDEQKRS